MRRAATRRASIILATLGAALGMSSACAETLLVVRKSGNALDFVDPGSGLRLATVPIGHAPHEVSVAPDGRRAVVSNYGTREQPGTTLSIVDLEHPREVRRIELAPHTRPHGVAWYAPDRIAVTTEGSQHLLLVQPDTGRILQALATGQQVSHMVAMSPDGGRAHVANIGSGSVTVLDLVAGRKLADVNTGLGSEGIAIATDGRELWVAAREVGEIAIVDLRNLEVIARLPLPGIPIRIAMAPDGHTAYVTCAGSSEVVAIDTTTREERRRLQIDVPLAAGVAQRPFAGLAPGSALPVGLLASPGGPRLYVAATMGDVVLRLDPRTLAVQQTIAVEGEPDGLAVTPILPRAECHACTPAP